MLSNIKSSIFIYPPLLSCLELQQKVTVPSMPLSTLPPTAQFSVLAITAPRQNSENWSQHIVL